MERLNEILRELGISKVKLAKFLGVSRQMIYNYLKSDVEARSNFLNDLALVWNLICSLANSIS